MSDQKQALHAILLATVIAVLSGSYCFSEVPAAEDRSKMALAGTEGFLLPIEETRTSKPRIDQFARSMACWKSEVPPLDLADKRSPLAQVTAMSLDIELAERLLRKHERDNSAEAISECRAMFDKIFRSEATLPSHTYPAVHMVGLYSPGKNLAPVHVRLSDHSGPFVLVLTGYESVDWIVENADKVDLRYIIASGYYTQRVKGVPPDIPVFNSSYEHRAGPYFYASERDDQFKTVCQTLEALTGGLQVTTFQGRYNAGEYGFDIGPENPDWRIQYLSGLMRQTHNQVLQTLARLDD